MIKILSCIISFSRYIKLFEVCHPPVVMIKILSCMIIFFALHQTASGVLPASCDELNIKLHDYFFSRYIKLFEVCHPPVVMIKILSCMISFSRYIKLFEVCHPPVVMIKILSCMIIFFALHQTASGVLPASCDELNIKLHDYFFCVTSNCLRCVTRQL